MLGETSLAMKELPDREFTVVGVGGWAVREDARAVDALPPERVVREGVEFVPAEFLGEEAVDVGGSEDLGKVARVSERVREPAVDRLDAVMLEEESLPEDELASERFTRREIGVRLHPHAPDRLELAGADEVLHLFEE